MTKIEHHDFTKATSSYYSSRMTSKQYNIVVKNILDKKPDYFTPDWQIQKIEQKQKREYLHN
jgi:hypothetical protein